jgi:hypothetical protein
MLISLHPLDQLLLGEQNVSEGLLDLCRQGPSSVRYLPVPLDALVRERPDMPVQRFVE